MYFVDSHTHTHLSHDGFVPCSEMARSAMDLGLDCLCVTDHTDFLTGEGKRDFSCDWDARLGEFHDALPLTRGRLKLLQGVELGSAFVSPEEAARVLDVPELDFVLGSLHNWSEDAGGNDFYFTKFASEPLCRRAMDNYLSSMEQLVKLPACYDSLAHIPYPLRYMERDGHPLDLADYYPRLSAILRAVAESGKAMEVNTFKGATLDAWPPLLSLFRSVGGEFVTVGSDAHKPDSIASGVRAALDLISDAGFRYVTVFERRRPCPMPL